MHTLCFASRVGILLEELTPGGGPAFALNLAERLVQRGHPVTVVTEREGDWWPELARRGVIGTVIRRSHFESLANHSRRLAAFLNAEGFGALLVNVSWDNRSAQIATHLVHDRTSVIPIVHGDWPVLYRLLEQDAGVWNCAVAVSPRILEELRHRFPDRPSHCILNGIPVPTEEELARRADWSAPLRLAFVGRLVDSHKGIFRLPKIMAACRRNGIDSRLTVIGEGPDGSALMRAFRAEGVADIVRCVGALPPGQVASALRDHHALVFPTNTEGMPLVVLEAQANGCVVLTSTLPGITDVAIEDGVSGFLAGPPDRGLSDRMVEAIARLSDRPTWQRLSRAGIERSRRLFSQETMGNAYSELIRALATGQHPVHRPGNKPQRPSGHKPRLPCGWLDHIPPFALPNPVVRHIRNLRHQFSTWRSRGTPPA